MVTRAGAGKVNKTGHESRYLWLSTIMNGPGSGPGRAVTRIVGVTAAVLTALFITLGSTGCGVSPEVKRDTAAVIGENGVTDDYLDAVVMVLENQRRIVAAFRAENPDVEFFTVEHEDETHQVRIDDYVAALDILIAHRPKLKKALHATNRAIQSNEGISGFTEQFLRTLQSDRVGDLFDVITDGE